VPRRSSPEPAEVASDLKLAIGLFLRRILQLPGSDELTIAEQATLSRLEHGGPTTASALARAEQVSPQAIGPIVAGLEERGLLVRSPDPTDGRRALLSLTASGRAMLRDKRSRRVEQIAKVLDEKFSRAELETLQAAAPLIKRLSEQL